jgi:hypothetical protein
MSKKLVSALVIGAALALAAPAHASSTLVFTGVDVAQRSWWAYLGGVTALQGQDIATQPGLLARISGGYGQYSYTRKGLSGVDGDMGDVDLMLGYSMPLSNVGKVTGFIGGDWADHSLSPSDPLNSVHGSEGGLKGQLEFAFHPMDHIEANAMGSYSTAFRTYWSREDIDYNFGAFSIGPEVGFEGNKEYNSIRYGARIGDIDLGFADVALHAGGVSSNRGGGDGAYGNIGFSKRF